MIKLLSTLALSLLLSSKSQAAWREWTLCFSNGLAGPCSVIRSDTNGNTIQELPVLYPADIRVASVLSLATNWTGITSGTNELGYVVTNHHAIVVYQEKTNSFFLKLDLSPVAVWRERRLEINTITNMSLDWIIPRWRGMPIVTNFSNAIPL